MTKPQLIVVRGGIPGQDLQHAFVGNVILRRGTEETLAEFTSRAATFAKSAHAAFCIIGGMPPESD